MAKKKTDEKVIEFKNKKKFRIGRSGLILTVVFVIAASYFAVSALKIVQLNAEKEKALARQEELLMMKEDLTAEYESISSAQYIERLARRDLKLVKSNELLFILPERELGKAAEDEELPEGEEGGEDGKAES